MSKIDRMPKSPDTNPLADVSDDELDIATDESKMKYDSDRHEGGESVLSTASTQETDVRLDEILPDEAKDSPDILENLKEAELPDADKIIDASIEDNPDVDLIKAATEAAKEIEDAHNKYPDGANRTAALEKAKQAFLESPAGREQSEDVIKEKLAILRNLIGVQADALEQNAAGLNEQVPIYRSVGNEELAQKRELEANALVSEAENRRAYASKLVEAKESSVEDLSEAAQVSVNRLEDPTFKLKDEVQKNDLVAQAVQEIESELWRRADAGEFDDATTMDALKKDLAEGKIDQESYDRKIRSARRMDVDRIRQSEQTNIEDRAQKKLEEYQEEIGGLTEGQKSFKEEDGGAIDDSEIDDMFAAGQ